MAHQAPLISSMFRITWAGFLLLLIESCANPDAIPELSSAGTHLSNFRPSMGVYGGSLIYRPWVYAGSSREGHHFTFTRHDGNALDSRQVIFSPKEIFIEHRLPLISVPYQWREARACDRPSKENRFI